MDDLEIKPVIRKRIRAPVEKVYAAWTDSAIMKQWFAPGEGMTVRNTEADPRVGGVYTIHMHDLDSGSDHIVSGEYQQVMPNRKLVFDW